MKKFISSLATFLTVVLVSAFIIPIAACTPENTCNIRVASMGGLALANVSVSINAGGNKIAEGTTDDNGIMRLILITELIPLNLTTSPKVINPATVTR